MNPERVLETKTDRANLVRIAMEFAKRYPTATDRSGILNAAGLNPPLYFGGSDPAFATAIVAWFLNTPVLAGQPGDHPLGIWSEWILSSGPENHGVFGDDVAILQGLITQVRDRSGALAARRSVVRLEDGAEQGFGSGVLVAPDLVLTCHHILTKSRPGRAWARFGHKVNFDGKSIASGVRFELDLEAPVAHGDGALQPDFLLVRLREAPGRPAIRVRRVAINQGQAVRLIHHPGGGPAEVSPPGQIRHVDDKYVLHDIPTQAGSSGAPLFNKNWEILAIHRGDSPQSRAGTTEGIPIASLLAIKAVVERLSPD